MTVLIEPEPNRNEWMPYAACRDLPVDIFFPGRGEKLNPAVIEACSRCPVIDQCRDWAVRHERMGFWALMSEDERKLERRRLGIPVYSPSSFLTDRKCGTTGGYAYHRRQHQAPCRRCMNAHNLAAALQKERAS